MIKNIGEQYILTPLQAKSLANTCTFFGKTVEACADLQYSTNDEEEFVHQALELCKYPEDRVAMCSMLGIELIPMPKKDEPKPKPRRLTINSGLGGGHAFMS